MIGIVRYSAISPVRMNVKTRNSPLLQGGHVVLIRGGAHRGEGRTTTCSTRQDVMRPMLVSGNRSMLQFTLISIFRSTNICLKSYVHPMSYFVLFVH